MLCAAADFHSRHALWKIRPQALRPVTGLNRPKCFCRTDTGIDELSCPCGYRAWFERGEEGRRRPDSGVAYLMSVGAVTVLCHRSLCYSSAPKTNIRARHSAVQNCSPFKLAPKPFLNPADAYPRPLRVIRDGAGRQQARLCPLCPDGDQNPHRSEMTRWATSGLMRCSKPTVCSSLRSNEGEITPCAVLGMATAVWHFRVTGFIILRAVSICRATFRISRRPDL